MHYGGGFGRRVFEGGMGERSAVAMAFGPFRAEDRTLYYASFENGGVIRRIAHDAPTAEVGMAKDAQGNPQPNYGDADATRPGLQMNFDASGSRDPNGQPLTYLWDFGDGSTQTTDSPTNSHTYDRRAKRTVRLAVRDGRGEVSEPATLDVFPGDAPPEPTISGPADEASFTVDGRITANGSASDPDAGDTAGLSWQVLQHHDGNHTHASETGGSVAFPGPRRRACNPRTRWRIFSRSG